MVSEACWRDPYHTRCDAWEGGALHLMKAPSAASQELISITWEGSDGSTILSSDEGQWYWQKYISEIRLTTDHITQTIQEHLCSNSWCRKFCTAWGFAAIPFFSWMESVMEVGYSVKERVSNSGTFHFQWRRSSYKQMMDLIVVLVNGVLTRFREMERLLWMGKCLYLKQTLVELRTSTTRPYRRK